MSSRLRVSLLLFVVVSVLVGGVLVSARLRHSNGGVDASVAATETTAAKNQDAEARSTSAPGSQSATATTSRTPRAAGTSPTYDLDRDEARGGHTLSLHVGKSEADLRERLRQEPEISAASSYSNQDIAEATVGRALDQGSRSLATWLKKGDQRANLVLRVTMPTTVGISLDRGARSAKEVRAAVVVLRARGADWFVLTSYPEDR